MNFSDSFRAARWMRFTNLLLQAILFLTLFTGLNYIALNHSWRFDITRNRQHTLSAETISYRRNRDRDVTITVTIPDDDRENDGVFQSYREISGLLREYAYVSSHEDAKGKIELKFLDVFKDGRRAAALGISDANAVIFDSGGNRKILLLTDFYVFKKTQREAFQGETATTAAILSVTNPNKKKIYFVSGHGEMGPENTTQRGLSRLRDQLRSRNFDVLPLDLTLTRSIPSDENPVLVIAAPQRRFQLYEEELLRNYLNTRAGRIIILLDSRASPGLENLFFEWGITVRNMIVIDPHPNSITETNDLRLWNYAPDPLSHITDTQINNDLALQVGETRVVTEDIGRPNDDGLRVVNLVATSKEAWGESDFYSMPRFTPGEDLKKGQQSTMVISERLKPANNLPLSVRGGRLVVFGSGDLVSNQRIDFAGNLNLFLTSLNWAADNDVQIEIPVRPIQRFSLALSQESLLRLRLALFLIIPGIVAIIGLIVYWTRRN